MRTHRNLAIVGILAAGLLSINCSSDDGGTPPARVATAIALISGNTQTGTVSTALANPIVVKVTDQDGAGMAGVSVAFAVTAGGGSVAAAAVTTNSQGEASTTWTLGPMAGTGNNGASASVTGLSGSPVGFTASATAGAATQIGVSSGDAQTGEAGAAVAQAPSVTVEDAHDNPVAGATVTWAVTAGGGTTAAGSSMTDATGTASMTWTLGALVGNGVHSLRASLAGGANAMFSASAVLTTGSVELNGGDNQSASANTAVAVPPSVLVKTPGGAPVQGVQVAWAVTAGGGATSAATSTTGANGVASIGWTLGGTVGANNQGLSATVAGLTGSPVAFVASATAPPTQMAMVSGDGQTGTAGQALAQPLVVEVQDASNAPVAGVTVNWSVQAGGGTLTAATSVTNGAGQASIGLTVGTAAGASNQTVRAAVAGLAGSPVDFTASVQAAAASQIAKSAGDGQTATVGTLLAQPIVALVRDQYGNPKAGVTVNWAAGAGSGSTAVASSVTDAAGLASTGWTIGTTAGTGNQSATATAAGLTGSPLTFTASATPGPATTLAIAGGDNQSGTVGAALPTPLAVLVTDTYGNGVGGVSVSWAAATGGGSMAAATSMTGPSGAASNTWTLGSTVGGQTATAAVAGTTPAMVTFNATGAALVSGYNITLRYISAMTPARQAVFDSAAARWSRTIVGDLASVPMNIAAGTCGTNSPSLNETVDDLLIFVTLDSIDGPGMVLGSAGPCYIRTANARLSIIGRMRFDTADVALMEANNIFNAVILHEMGHVIGIGTLWNPPIATPPPPLLIGAGTADPYFIGATAISGFNASGGLLYAGPKVPVENTGGAGTRDGHWRESVMGRELMTGYVSLIANPLSSITIGSLADAGYSVSYLYADAYTVGDPNLRLGAEEQTFKLIEAPPDWTIKSVDSQGRIVSTR